MTPYVHLLSGSKLWNRILFEHTISHHYNEAGVPTIPSNSRMLGGGMEDEDRIQSYSWATDFTKTGLMPR